MSPDREACLVVGADGTLGNALMERARERSYRTVCTTRRHETVDDDRVLLDLALGVQEWPQPQGISCAFLLAAVTSLERCRTEPEASALVNVTGTVELARRLVADGAFVVYPSTNLVFDGKEACLRPGELLTPQTEYGRQKARAESELRMLGDSVSIVRLSKVLGSGFGLFESWIACLRDGAAIHPFTDMRFSPVPVTFVVEAMLRIAERRLTGITQISGERDVTYADAAHIIAQRLGVDMDLVQPKHSSDSGLNFEFIPKHTTFETSRLTRELGMEPPAVELTISNWVDAYLEESTQSTPPSDR